MSRRNGACHFRHTVDITGRTMIQAFQSYELQNEDGTPVDEEQLGMMAVGPYPFYHMFDVNHRLIIVIYFLLHLFMFRHQPASISRDVRKYKLTIPLNREEITTENEAEYSSIAAQNATRNSIAYGTPVKPIFLEHPTDPLTRMTQLAAELLESFIENCNNSRRPVYLTNNEGNKHLMLVNPVHANELLRYDKVFSLIQVPDRGLQLIPNPYPENKPNEYTVVPVEHIIRNVSHNMNITSAMSQQHMLVGLGHIIQPYGSYLIDSMISALLSTVEEFCDNNFGHRDERSPFPIVIDMSDLSPIRSAHNAIEVIESS